MPGRLRHRMRPRDAVRQCFRAGEPERFLPAGWKDGGIAGFETFLGVVQPAGEPDFAGYAVFRSQVFQHRPVIPFSGNDRMPWNGQTPQGVQQQIGSFAPDQLSQKNYFQLVFFTRFTRHFHSPDDRREQVDPLRTESVADQIVPHERRNHHGMMSGQFPQKPARIPFQVFPFAGRGEPGAQTAPQGEKAR